MSTATTTDLIASPAPFDASAFFRKVLRVAASIPFVIDLVALYYCMVDVHTPMWAKASIAGALVYFVNPVDLIPDIIAVFGYADDATVVAGAVTAVKVYLHPSHYERAAALFA